MLNKRTLIIGISILIIIILAIIGLFFTSNKAATPEQTLYKDPASGETIVDNSPLRQSSANNPDIDRPTFLGFSTLLNKGLAASQLDNVENTLYNYSSLNSLGFKEISVVVADVQTHEVTDDGTYKIDFPIRVNRKTDYYVVVTYKDFTNCTTSLYKSDKTSLLFTQ